MFLIAAGLSAVGCAPPASDDPDGLASWLASDHHIHTQYSLRFDPTTNPPTPLLRTHGFYPVPHQAVMARYFGLAWMVITDHGGRQHSKVNFEQAYPSLLLSRKAIPEVIQFYGVELNAPGAEHASVIVPHTHEESTQILDIESQFDRGSGMGLPRLTDPDADSEQRMLEALEFMRRYTQKPVVIANHPSRTATDGAKYGRYTSAELRGWNDAAPDVAVGMAGAPGHQAGPLIPQGSDKTHVPRGDYPGRPTFGGFDPMTAELGGFWDSMLAEGRRWWITANSDSHRHWTEGGNDFWPGEYSKTFVYASKEGDAILTALRNGRVFVTTGDLISELYIAVSTNSGSAAGIGGELAVFPGEQLTVTIRVQDPDMMNGNGDNPAVNRVDLIAGRESLT